MPIKRLSSKHSSNSRKPTHFPRQPCKAAPLPLTINATNWGLFCKRFEDEHRGALVTLDLVNHDGTTGELARGLPLRQFKFEKTESCNDLIRITLGEAPQGIVEHAIVDPIHLRLKEEDGQKKLLLIDAEAGSVEMRFSSGRIGKLLQDLEIG